MKLIGAIFVGVLCLVSWVDGQGQEGNEWNQQGIQWVEQNDWKQIVDIAKKGKYLNTELRHSAAKNDSLNIKEQIDNRDK